MTRRIHPDTPEATPAPTILWLASPAAGAIAAALLAESGRVGPILPIPQPPANAYWRQVGQPLLQELISSLPDALYSASTAQVCEEVQSHFPPSWALPDTVSPAALAHCLLHTGPAGWLWQWQHSSILTLPPIELHRNQNGDLHCEDGPAILYRDGSGMWAANGQSFGLAHILHRPGPVTLAEIVREAKVMRFLPKNTISQNPFTEFKNSP